MINPTINNGGWFFIAKIRTNEGRAEMELKEAIVHCDEIIKKMDNCDCRKEHEELKERDTAKMCKQSIFDHDSITCVCGSDMDKDVEFMFCPWCGQRLKKWEE